MNQELSDYTASGTPATSYFIIYPTIN